MFFIWPFLETETVTRSNAATGSGALSGKLALLHALIIRDFNVEYVAGYTSSTLPLRYTVSAFWGGQKGSLLFWTLNLAFFSAIVHLQNRDKNRELMPYVTVTLMVVALFFLSLLALSAEDSRDVSRIFSKAGLRSILSFLFR
jgi:cytochrome c-type biogenesis protein CcmF